VISYCFRFHDGDEARPDPDFGLEFIFKKLRLKLIYGESEKYNFICHTVYRLCQLDATRDRAGEYRKNTWVILVTFGEHCLHHLFPTVCHSKLHHIKPALEQTLRDFSEEFPPMFQWELYLGCFQQLARTEPKKLKNKSD
jgi:hypothetical protein